MCWGHPDPLVTEIRIRIRPFSHKGVEQIEIMLAKNEIFKTDDNVHGLRKKYVNNFSILLPNKHHVTFDLSLFIFQTLRHDRFAIYQSLPAAIQSSLPAPSSISPEPVLLNVYGVPELIPRNEFRQPV